MKTTAISIIIAGLLILGAILYTKGNGEPKDNVSIVEGRQIIIINAKGGYFPNITYAKADTPTIIRMNTRGTFDCSSALTIPKLGYNKVLPPSGETEIDVSAQEAGTVIQGLCSMGMYGFQVRFD